jgi:tetratricopeptide (TPR) repeat protein
MPKARDDETLRPARVDDSSRGAQNDELDDELVMNLVELALSQPPDAREDYLRSACSGKPELFSQVWDYVQWNHRMQGFLLEPLYPGLREHQFEPGELLADRFRIARDVGQGGMGIVYEAYDERLKLRIALKCAKSGFRKRLPPEVRLAREITHPNVCKIFEIHTAMTPNGEIDFLTMEFLEGETLAERLSRGPLPVAEARAIGRQICAGLAEAHRHGVVHGDLKSNNVILAQDEARGDPASGNMDGGVRAVVTDFGLARKPFVTAGDFRPAASSAAGSNASRSALSSQAGGTPDYMAPELWKGEKPSAASDVYALGVILYELAANRRPYAREVPWQDRLKHKPPAVHHGWDSILQRCLDPDPARRFQDAGEVAAALEPSHARRWWLAAAAAVVLAAVSGAVTYQRATAPKESIRLAMLPIESPSADTAALAGDLSRDAAGQLRRLKGGSVARLTFVDASPNAIAAVQATHKLRATLTNKDGKLLLHAVLTDARSGVNMKDWSAVYAPGEVRRYAPVALAGMVTGTLRLPPLAVAAVNPAAVKDYWDGVWYTRQNSTLAAALRSLKQAVAKDPDSALTYAALAEAQWFEYYYRAKDRTWLDSTRESLREAEGRDLDVPAAHRVEGYLDYDEGFYAQAIPEFERAIQLQPDNATAHIWLGKTYEEDSELDRALPEFLKATEVEPRYFRTWQNLGAYYQNRSDYSAMARYHKMAVDLAPNEANLHSNLAAAFMLLGDFPGAETEYRRSLDLEKTPTAEYNLGQVLMNEENDLEAVKYFDQALDLLDLPSPPGLTRRHFVLMYLGIAERRLGNFAAANRHYQEGLESAKQAVRENSRDGSAKVFLGYFKAALRDRRDAEDAEDDIRSALSLSKDDSATRWRAVLTYEELYRRFKEPIFRKDALGVLEKSTADQLKDVDHWPDLKDLRADPDFRRLLPQTQPVK